jgi:colicin import membrane protein
MARKLKTYITSIGFYDLAIAAPSMKAALEAWGSNQNLFHQGQAQETDSAPLVTATMAQPGVVLRRPVGSKGAYKEKPDAPRDLPVGGPFPPRREKPILKKAKAAAAKGKNPAAILSFEKAKAKRDAARKKEEALAAAQRKRDAARITQATAKANDALERAKAKHDDIIAKIDSEREALDRRTAREKSRWDKERHKFEDAVSRAGR